MSSQRRSSPFSLTPLIRGLATIISMFAILHQMELDMPCFCSVGNLRSLRWVDYVFQTRGKPWWKIVDKFIAFLCRFVFFKRSFNPLTVFLEGILGRVAVKTLLLFLFHHTSRSPTIRFYLNSNQVKNIYIPSIVIT